MEGNSCNILSNTAFTWLAKSDTGLAYLGMGEPGKLV